MIVLPESLMDDRNVDTFLEALRNVPSITFNAGECGRIGDNITLRGFSVVGDLYLDGIRDIAQYKCETFNAEQIEVLRGSSSMLSAVVPRGHHQSAQQGSRRRRPHRAGAHVGTIQLGSCHG